MVHKIDNWLTALVLRVVPRWCKPNHITGVRIVLIPLIWAFYYEISPWAATAMFTLLALTDFVDGRVARGRGQVTRGGKVLDIACDLMLVWCTVFLLAKESIIFSSHSTILFWLLVTILFREVVVTTVRLATGVRAGDVRVNMLGKCKTGFLMVGLAVLLTSAVWPNGFSVGALFVGIATVCSVFSGLQYVHQFTSRRM